MPPTMAGDKKRRSPPSVNPGEKFEYLQKIKLTIDEWQMRKLPVTSLSQEPTFNNMDYFG